MALGSTINDRRSTSGSGGGDGAVGHRSRPSKCEEDRYVTLAEAAESVKIEPHEINSPPCPSCGNTVGHRSARCPGRAK